jgi:ElaB/YqjD/DUF883 family membrane-anchored ribosome-binding protein
MPNKEMRTDSIEDIMRSGGSGISDSVSRGKDAVLAVATDAMSSAGSDLQSLRADINSLKDVVTKFISQASAEAAKSAQEVTTKVAGQVGGVASDLADSGVELASTASKHAKSFASEIEGTARRNPIGAIASALMIGILIGFMGRRS